MIRSTIFFFFLAACASAEDLKARVLFFKASATWPGNQEGIGIIDFVQKGDTVYLNGSVNMESDGLHGFHVHQFADLSNNCLNTGGHFNPHKKNHGAPQDSDRHVGDLGNIQASRGMTNVEMSDKVISLNGENSILGRAVVIHVGQDDLGKGGSPDSLTTGHAGARYACGVIGITGEADNSAPQLSIFVALLASLFLPLIAY